MSKSSRSASKSETAEPTLESLAKSVEGLPTTRRFNALQRDVDRLLWALEELGEKSGLDLTQEAYKTAQAEAKKERGTKAAPHLEVYRQRFEVVKEEMTAANGGTAPTRDEAQAECRRRKEAGEAPFDGEAPAAKPAPKSAAKPAGKPAAKAPAAAKPAAKAPAKPKA